MHVEVGSGLHDGASACKRGEARTGSHAYWRQLTSTSELGLHVVAPPTPWYASTVGS